MPPPEDRRTVAPTAAPGAGKVSTSFEGVPDETWNSLTDWSWELVGDDRLPHTRMLIGCRAHDNGWDALYVHPDGSARLFRRDAERALRMERAGELSHLLPLLKQALPRKAGEPAGADHGAQV